MPQNFYQILGIPTTASAKTIQKAFHKLAKTYHPDRNPQNNLALEQFKLISEAYKTLSNPTAKSKYDFKIRYGTPVTKVTYGQPPPAPRMARAAKRTFTRRAQVLGGVSVIFILAVVIISSFILLRYNARYNFQRGLSNYENKRYSASYFNLKQSLGVFNPYQATTHFLMADICFSQHAENQLTVNHINLALQANPSDSLRSRL